MIDAGFKHVYDLSQKTTKKINHEGDYTHRKIDWIWVREESGLVRESMAVIDQEQMLPSLENGYPSDHHYLVAKIV